MEINRLLIRRSLVRAQVEEPINTGLTAMYGPFYLSVFFSGKHPCKQFLGGKQIYKKPGTQAGVKDATNGNCKNLGKGSGARLINDQGLTPCNRHRCVGY